MHKFDRAADGSLVCRFCGETMTLSELGPPRSCRSCGQQMGPGVLICEACGQVNTAGDAQVLTGRDSPGARAERSRRRMDSVVDGLIGLLDPLRWWARR